MPDDCLPPRFDVNVFDGDFLVTLAPMLVQHFDLPRVDRKELGCVL